MKCPELPRLTLRGLATARSTHMNQRTGCGVVHLDLICLVSSHKWQACRIEGAIAIMHVHGRSSLTVGIGYGVVYHRISISSQVTSVSKVDSTDGEDKRLL